MPLASPNAQRQSLPDVMTFRKTWRAYQSCLLSHLDGYLQNRRLHLVAAPGSGKTVLGLEVIKRVNQPTLVLAPTITIRDQWVDRLVDLFLPPGSDRPAWVSTELRSPAFLTIATYQDCTRSARANQRSKHSLVKARKTVTLRITCSSH